MAEGLQQAARCDCFNNGFIFYSTGLDEMKLGLDTTENAQTAIANKKLS
jgi:hypothetical protein